MTVTVFMLVLPRGCMPLTYVTSNDDKLKEAEAVLGRSMDRKAIDLPEIQAVELEQVARHKVQEAATEIDPPVMVSDTGLFFDDWAGFPGALIKWCYERMGNDGICTALGANRGAKALTCIAVNTGDTIITVDGTVTGRITEQPRGTNGFAWDKIFQPDGHEQTFAEMPSEKKNDISMRKEALIALRDRLDDQEI